MFRLIISLRRGQVDLLELLLYQRRLFSRTSDGNLWLAEEDAEEDNAKLTIWNDYDVSHINWDPYAHPQVIKALGDVYGEDLSKVKFVENKSLKDRNYEMLRESKANSSFQLETTP